MMHESYWHFGPSFGGFGIVWVLAMAALVIVPFWRILPRAGIPAWVAIFSVIPLVALILLWVVAFRDRLDGGRT